LVCTVPGMILYTYLPVCTYVLQVAVAYGGLNISIVGLPGRPSSRTSVVGPSKVGLAVKFGEEYICNA